MQTAENPLKNHRFHVGIAPFVAADKSTYATYSALNADSKSDGVIWIRDGKILDSIILSTVDAEAFKQAALDHFAVQSPITF